jgi:hypothetical protein
MTSVNVIGKGGVQHFVTDWLSSRPGLEVTDHPMPAAYRVPADEADVIILPFMSDSGRRVSRKYLSTNRDHIERMIFLAPENELKTENELLREGLVEYQVVPVPTRVTRDLPGNTRKSLSASVQLISQQSVQRDAKSRGEDPVTPPEPAIPRWIMLVGKLTEIVAKTGVFAWARSSG